MRTKLAATLGGLTLVTGVLAWQLAIVPAGAAKPGVQVIRLEEHSEDDTGAYIDVGEEGVTVGDYFPIVDPLFRLGGEGQIGRTTGNCMILEAHPETQTSIQECWFSFDLPGGIITAQGPFDFSEPGPYSLAVTGGTESFQRARGTLKVGGTERGATFTFKLLR